MSADPPVKRTTIEVAEDLLGDNVPEILTYKKFRRLTKSYPDNTNFQKNFAIAQVKLQTAISRFHNKTKSQLKEKKDQALLDNKTKAEMLMRHWGFQFY